MIKFKASFAFALLLTCGLPVVACADTIEDKIDEIKHDYLPHIKNQAAGRGGDVREAINSIPKDEDPVEDIEAFVKMKNFHGADPGETERATEEDKKYITGSAFTQCQGANPPHSHADIIRPPTVVIDGTPPEYPGNVCYSIHFKFNGQESGGCYKRVGHVQFCGDVVLWSDLVAYNYPTHKIDVSEQPYQTVYIPKELYAGHIQENEDFLKEQGAEIALSNLGLFQYTVNLHGALNSKNTLEPLGSDALDIAEEAIKRRNELPDTLKHLAGNQNRAYSRNIDERLDLVTANKWFIPHTRLPARQHFFGTDLPDGFPYAKSLGMSAILAFQFDDFFLRAGGIASCVGNNKATGKTPIDLAPQIFPWGGSGDLCLDRLGERFPPNETRRQHITDRGVRAIAANIDLHNVLKSPAERYSFHEDEDLFLPIRNKAYKEEGPQCVTLKDLPKLNIDFDKSNMKEIKRGGEIAVEVFTAFKGCWGFKASSPAYWTEGIHQWGPSQTSDQLRQE